MNEKYTTKDRRGLVWLNEIGVLRALANNKNIPMYVGEIASSSPVIWSISRDELKMFTRPGVKAACIRLVERKVLEETSDKTPNKSMKTPHYRIVPNMSVFAKILSDYGTGILDDLRSTNFGEDTIRAGLNEWLKMKLFFERDLDGIAPIDDVRMIREFASISTTALTVLLSDNIPLGYDEETDHSLRMQLRIRHLLTIMHLATAFDITKKPAVQLVDENMIVQIKLESTITIGSQSLTSKSEYDSETVAAKQRALIKKQREIVQASSI